jgi:hypothetical protein
MVNVKEKLIRVNLSLFLADPLVMEISIGRALQGRAEATPILAVFLGNRPVEGLQFELILLPDGGRPAFRPSSFTGHKACWTIVAALGAMGARRRRIQSAGVGIT